MVFATDKVRKCAALLMTLDLSNKIQEALWAERECHQAEQANEREGDMLFRFESKLGSAISSVEYQIEDVTDGDGTASDGNLPTLKTDSMRLTEMLKDTQRRSRNNQVGLKYRWEKQRAVQAEVNAILEEAL